MNNNLKKIIICIPTRNRSEIVDDVLKYSAEYYFNNSLNVVYFDTSTDDSTRNVIKKYHNIGFKNISWKRVENTNSIDQKVFDIFQNNKEIRKYQYCWLINDSISIKDDFLYVLNNKLFDDYDLIRLAAPGYGKKCDQVFENQNEWFFECSVGMAHMASTIMNTRLLLNADWKYLYDRYVGNDVIGDNQHQYFFTVALYLEQILKIDNFRGLMVGNCIQWRHDSRLKNGRSYWNDCIFDVWARSYCDTILRLPDYYTRKKDVIRKSDNIIFERFEKHGLELLKIQGIFSEQIVEEYRDYWQYVSALTIEEISEIANKDINTIEKKNDSWEENLLAIEKTITDKPVIVFGAGMLGEYVMEMLIRDGYADKILGVAVTNAMDNVNSIMGYNVKSIGEYNNCKTTALVIISTKHDAADTIEKQLQKIGFVNISRVL